MIRVLVIDDSLFMRQMISDVLNAEKNIEVVAVAKSGEEGLQKLVHYNPDVVTLDYEMPGLNGVATLKKIMRGKPTPVIMVSAYTRKAGMVTLQALREGAVDYVLKPSGPMSLDIGSVADQIVHRVNVASKVNITQLASFLEKKTPIIEAPEETTHNFAVVIGSSTGGVTGVEYILSSFPEHFSASVFVVQHLPEMFAKSFAERLNTVVPMKVQLAENGMQAQKGVAYVAPGGNHLEVTCTQASNVCPDGEAYMQVSKSPVVCGFRPSITVLMKSIAEIYGSHAVGILLSGMGVDGVEGMEAIVQHGGTTLAQNKETSVVYGMAREAVEIGAVDDILPIDRIAKKVVETLDMKERQKVKKSN
jgi:two-component system, chemotaxis family, protein-glutamate methylesterase/glutaminase